MLQSKQESVLELLARADSQAVDQSSQRQVHTSMSETLAEAWKDLNHEMDLRQSLLDQNVAFHESAKQVWFTEEMSSWSPVFLDLLICILCTSESSQVSGSSSYYEALTIVVNWVLDGGSIMQYGPAMGAQKATA